MHKLYRLVGALLVSFAAAACQGLPPASPAAPSGAGAIPSGQSVQPAAPLKNSVLGLPIRTGVKNAQYRGNSRFEILARVTDYKGQPLTGLDRRYFKVRFEGQQGGFGTIDSFAEDSDGTYWLGVTAPTSEYWLGGLTLGVWVSDHVEGLPLYGILPPPAPGSVEFPPGAKLTGRFTFGGNSPPQLLTAQYKKAGAGSRETARATTDTGGHFFFEDVPAGDYQFIWDDGGDEVKTGDVNTMGIFVSDPVTSPPGSLTAPQRTMDLRWEPRPRPGPGGEAIKGTSTAFTFETVPYLDATYQISIFNASRQAQTPTATANASPISLDTSSLSAGSYVYMIKFFKKGDTFGGKNFYGATKYISFSLK